MANLSAAVREACTGPTEKIEEKVSTVWIVKEIGGKGKASLLDKVGELADSNLRLFRVSNGMVSLCGDRCSQNCFCRQYHGSLEGLV